MMASCYEVNKQSEVLEFEMEEKYNQTMKFTEKEVDDLVCDIDLDGEQNDGQILSIDLGKEIPGGQEYKIFIDYTAKPTEGPEGGSAAITSDLGLFFINNDGSDANKPMQIWTQGETQSNSAWFPTIDSPNAKTTQEIFITVEDKFMTLSNGKLAFGNHSFQFGWCHFQRQIC